MFLGIEGYEMFGFEKQEESFLNDNAKNNPTLKSSPELCIFE